MTGASLAEATGTEISAKEPGRRVRSLGSSMLAVMSTRRDVSSADSATWTTLAVNSRLSSRTRKRASWPGLIRAASRSGTRNLRRSGSRRTSVARTVPVWTYWPVWTVRVWMTPEMGALTKASRRLSLAWLRAERFSATSEAAVRTLVRQVSTSSPGMSPGFWVVTVSRRLSPASASALEASAFS